MPVSLDLRKAHMSRVYGDILAVFSWMDDKRALFLIPHRRRRAPWFVVPEEAAHEWSDQDRANFLPSLTGNQRRRLEKLPAPVREAMLHDLAESGLAARATKACIALGIEPSQINQHRVINIVNDSIADLVRMPSAPEPEFNPETYGQILLRADGKPIAAEDIKVEREGVTYG